MKTSNANYHYMVRYAIALALPIAATSPAAAQDATWLFTPGTNDFNTAANWTPATVPAAAGTASFGATKTAALSFSDDAFVGGFTFNADAPAYTFTVGRNLDFSGAGIINNSSKAPTFQNFLFMSFSNGSTAGNAIIINNNLLEFLNTSTAGNATITNNDTLNFRNKSSAGNAKITNDNTLNFKDTSTAGNANITNNSTGVLKFIDTSTAGTATILNVNDMLFSNGSSAGNATITNNSFLSFELTSTAGNANITTAAGGLTRFFDESSAGKATITNNGVLQFRDSSTADGATITTKDGGFTQFIDTSSGFNAATGGGAARMIAEKGGQVDISQLSSDSTSFGSIEGAGLFTLGGKSLTVGLNNLSTTVSGIIDGPDEGSLTKVGTGTLTLSGINTYTGATTVNGGALIVDGSIDSHTTVNAGGTLGGSGSVGNTGNTSIEGGTLAPGSAAGGTLTVRGDLSFTAASTYMIQVTKANAGRTDVTGTATLGDAAVKVKVVFAPDSSVNRQYTILNADVRDGTFNPSVTSNVANVQCTLSYDDNNVFLNNKLNFGAGLNVNQQNVANAFTNFLDTTTTGRIATAFASLNAAGLSIAWGELGTGVIQSSIKADDLFLNLLLDPSVAGRAGGFGSIGSAARFAADDETRKASPGGRDAYAMATKANLLAAQPVNSWSVWGAAYGGSATTDGNATVGSHDTTARVWGVVAGADYKASPDTLLGFALAGGGTSYTLSDGLGRGSSDLFQAGAFAKHNFGPAYISAALAYGWHDVTTNRNVMLAGIDQLQGRFRAETFSGRFEGGYRFATPAIGITPYAAAQVISFNLPAYAEQALTGGALFALNYASQTTTATRGELGLRTDKSIAMQDGILTLRGRAAWAHDYNPDRAVTAIFQALPGAAFVVNGARADPDAALVSAGAEMKWLSGFSLAATFEGEFSGNTTSYSGKGVARYSW